MSDDATPRPWKAYSGEDPGTDGPKYATKAEVMVYADEDCESHPIADCSANHTCRMDWECEANAALIVRAVNSFEAMREALERIAKCDYTLRNYYDNCPEIEWEIGDPREIARAALKESDQ